MRVVLKGGFGSPGEDFEISEPSLPVSRLLRVLAERYPDAFYSDGSPRPGILVFVDGVDSRLLDGEEEVQGDVEVRVIRVFHGG